MDGYLAPASGSGRFSTNRWSASGRIVCGTAGRIFTNYSTTFGTKSDVTAQLTVGISRENLPMKPVDWCSWLPAVCSDDYCSRRSGCPLARCLPIMAGSTLYLWCKRRCCHTLCWHLMLHRNTQLGICQYSQLEWQTTKWLALVFYWTTYQYRAQRLSLQHRGRHPHRQEKSPVK